jgi:bifunctional DNA-binding transcriptional regulator/antitoxin component of YhaV-PrlF toxin-antitoxin module
MEQVAGFRVSVDRKHRSTLPVALLRAAGLDDSRELVARVERPGRIVLEDPAAALAEFQAVVANGLAAASNADLDLVADLLDDRARDATAG